MRESPKYVVSWSLVSYRRRFAAFCDASADTNAAEAAAATAPCALQPEVDVTAVSG